MLIWTATESCATIMCSSIPILRPLYIRIRYGKNGKNSSAGSGGASYKLPLYGSGRTFGKFSKSGRDPSDIESSNVSYPRTVINPGTNNRSSDNILEGAATIERTDEISVSYEQFAGKV